MIFFFLSLYGFEKGEKKKEINLQYILNTH
jgi:hypothetical protein